MSLIKDISELKAVLGGVQKNLNWDTWSPQVDTAETSYVIPYISEAEYTVLNAAHNGGSPSADQSTAIGLLQKAVAFYTLLDTLPQINVKTGEAGVMQPVGEDLAPASRWAYHKLEEQAARKGDEYLERALAFMEANSASFAAFLASSAFTARKELLVNDVNTASKWIDIASSRRLFMALKRYMRDIEETRIRPVISDDMLEELYSEIQDESISGDNLTLVQKLQPAILNLAMVDAIPAMSLKVTASGVYLITENDGLQSRLQAPEATISRLQEKYLEKGEFYLKNAWKFLDENHSSYPTYEESDAYQEAGETKKYEAHDNTGAKSFMA